MKALLAAAAILAAVLIPGIAAAQQCLPKALFMQIGKERYGEAPIFTGIATNRSLLIIMWNAETGDWTVAVEPPGTDCITPLGSGKGGNLHAPDGSM